MWVDHPGERIFIELMTSDRKVKASTEGSKSRNDGTYRTKGYREDF
jgi:hypothetical protein